jgi:murein DD-endopeptidase MepM/ murein hydrolase activator NlpD
VATPRRTLRVAIALAVAALAAVPAAFPGSVSDRRELIDGRIAALRNQIARDKEQEGVLSSQIEAASGEIEAIEGDIGALASKLQGLEAELARFRARLAALEDRYRTQTRYLRGLRRDHALAQRFLEERLVALYESGESSEVAVLLQVESLGALVEQIEFLNEIGRQDQRIVAELRRLKIAMREAREQTGALRDQVAEATQAIAAKTEEARSAQAALIAQHNALAAARDDRQALLANTREDRHDAEEDLDALLAQSAALAAQIQASSSSGSGSSSSGTSDSTPSSSGLIWPVSGTVTSGYGYRWGRMHEGIDIAAPTGTTVHASASGRVIIAGWMGGYGQIVVIDHGNGLSTAYAHLSSIYAGGGSVSQGQSIGAVGCTGSCTGPHLHFEVRVNGGAVDPMGYL